MSRRTLLLAACLVSGLVAAPLLSVTDTSAGIFSLGRTSKTRSLREQLAGKLRPRSPQEFAFLDRVVRSVERGTLPLRLVQSTFNWARKRRARYRFPYFQRALQVQAAKQGIRIR